MDDSSNLDPAAPKDTSQRPPRSEPDDPVLVSLSIERGEPITGTLTTSGATTSTPFCGWMELIAAITSHRDGHST